ncbi:Glucose dehydrogenase -like protein [Halotydeus destructor]|nr:Glucose dehydrogenase -like protein [Halotydeus destructor]
MDEVVVDPKYLQGDGDMKEAISAMSALIKLAQAKAMREINMTAVAPKYAGCDSTPWSDDYIRCYLKVNAYSSYHFSGTCKMGNSSDPMAVIDDQLRVYGVQNLRVADGSIWPTVPRAHPTAPAIMVGEVLSSLISQGPVDQLTTSSQATMIDAIG